MLKITGVSKYKGSTYMIEFEEGETAFLSYEIVSAYGLRAGLDMPESAWEKIVFDNEFRKAKERALYLLDYRDYSYVELYKKLESGKKLSADELQYLRMNDPVTYAKAARVQMMRESFKKQLESAKSKEQAADMYLQNMSRIADDDPAKKELEAAYNDVYSQFKKTEAYKKLPDTEKEAKEEKAKKNGNKDNTKVEWEEDKEENSEINEIPLDDF